jgi:hypothetical protein
MKDDVDLRKAAATIKLDLEAYFKKHERFQYGKFSIVKDGSRYILYIRREKNKVDAVYIGDNLIDFIEFFGALLKLTWR